MRVVYEDSAVFSVSPYDWSFDGASILVYLRKKREDPTQQLAIVSLVNGEMRVLKAEKNVGEFGAARFSPDGRFIAVDVEQKGLSAHYDILLIDAVTGRESMLVGHPSDDQMAAWAPDGERVLFTSHRSGAPDLWMIQVTNGQVTGAPVLLKRSFSGEALRMTRDGSLFYRVLTDTSDVYVVQLNDTGQFVGQPRIVSSKSVGSTKRGDWSPDGKQLAYLAGRDRDPIVTVYSIDDGTERTIQPIPRMILSYEMDPRWSPDSKSLLVYAAKPEHIAGFYAIDATTGEASLLLGRGPKQIPKQPAWSPDGETIYFTDSNKRIVAFEIATGKMRELYRVDGEDGGLAGHGLDISPDGRNLAFYHGKSLAVIPSIGADPREIIHFEDTFRRFVRWTPDGTHLLYPKRRKEFWSVDIVNGQQRQISSTQEGAFRSAAMHPDGEKVTFTIDRWSSELWVMQKFLPPLHDNDTSSSQSSDAKRKKIAR